MTQEQYDAAAAKLLAADAPPTAGVLMLLHRCPHTATHVSSYCYKWVLILLNMCLRRSWPMRLPPQVFSCYYICVLIFLHVCPHTTESVSGRLCWQAVGPIDTHSRFPLATTRLASSCYCECVLILLFMYPHTPIYMCPRSTMYVSSYYCISSVLMHYICVLILVYI